MEDITPQTGFATSSQPDAITNISNAKLFNVDPVTYKDNKDVWAPEVQQMSLPPVASRTVADAVSESPEHAAAVAPDAKNLSEIEKIFGDISNKVHNLNPQRDLNELLYKKLAKGNSALEATAGKFSDEDDYKLAGMQEDAKNNFGQPNYGLDTWYENLPGNVVSGVTDFAKMAFRNKALTASIIGSSTAVGAGAGFVSPIPGGTIAGGIGGAIVGAKIASGIVPFYDGYKAMAGEAYGVLDNIKDTQTGAPMDDNTKKNLAHGIGVVAGGIQMATDVALLKGLPFMRTFLNPAAMSEKALAQPAFKAALLSIGKSMATNATGTGAQEIAHIVGEEIGNTYKNGETSFTDGIIRAAQKLATNEKGTSERVATAATTGALVGAAVHTAFGGIQKGIDLVKNPVKIGTPEAPTITAPDSDLSVNTHSQAAEVLDFQTKINEASSLGKQTGLQKQSPTMFSDLRQKMLDNAGLKRVWFNKDDLSKIATDDATAAKIRNSIDKTGASAAAMNAAVPMDMHKFLDLHDEGLPVDEWVKLHPEGPNPNEAEQFAKNIDNANAKRADLNQKLGMMGEKTPEERAAVVPLNLDMSIDEVSNSLQSKEVADAYISRLDKASAEEVQKPMDPTQVAKLTDIKNMRQRIVALKETLPDEVGAKATLKQALDTTFPKNNIHNEQDFLTQPNFTKAIKGVLLKEEVVKKNNAILSVKKDIVSHIDDLAKYEMNEVIDIQKQEAMDAVKLNELDKLDDSPFLALADKFKHRDFEGKKLYAIDPKKLSKEQKAEYLNNEQLKAHGVFEKNGLSPEESATLVGVKGGENFQASDSLLKILSQTPTRDEIANTRSAVFEPSVHEEVLANTDLNHTAIEKAYHAKTALDLDVAETMREAHWKTTEKGIKRAALPLPKRVEALTRQADNAVANTKVGELNANQFKVGQRNNQKIAVESELKGDYEKAAHAKEAEALNTEMTASTHKAIGEVNKVIKFVKKFNDPKNMQILKDAGVSYVNAVNEILDVWNFNTSKKDQSERGSFQKWVKEQVQEGHGNFEIPERLSDLRESVNEMTVDQVKVVGDRLKSLFEQAKRKNELYLEYGPKAQKANALQSIADTFHQSALEHPDYNPKRAVPIPAGTRFAFERVANGINEGLALFKGMEHIILNLDDGKVGGYMNEHVMAPLKGIGKYSATGEAGKHTDAIALQGHVTKMIEKFGKKEWESLKNDRVYIPEFKDNPRLHDGYLNKWALFKMMLNMGNEGNQERMARGFTELDGEGNTLHSTDIDTIRAVLERELDTKHAVLAQNIWDTYKSYFPRVVKLHEETMGVTPEMVDPSPYDHKGVRHDGGYFPLITAAEMDVDKVRKSTQQVIDAASGKKPLNLKDFFYADDMTKHSFTEQRTNSSLPIDLSGGLGMHFEMLIHDLNFRKPVADALKIVTHPVISKDMANIVGTPDYNTVVNTIVKAAGSVQAENTRLFDGSGIFSRMEARARSGLQAGYLVGNLSSVLIQPTSMIQASARLGLSGVPHLTNVMAQMSKNPFMIDKYYEFAGDINPMIRDVIQGLDENTTDPLRKIEPKQNWNKITKGFDHVVDKINDYGYKQLGRADQVQKVIITLAAYSQFMAGDAEGHSNVKDMTPTERDSAAKVYASSAARLTLTAGSQLDRAPIQGQYKWVTMFFNDARNELNNVLRQGREVRQNLQSGTENLKAGDYKNSFGNYKDAAAGTVGALATLAAIRSYSDTIRGYSTPWSSRDHNGRADKKFAKIPDPHELLSYFGWAAPDVISGNLPIARDINYGWQTLNENPKYQKDVQFVPGKILADLGRAAIYGIQFMQYAIGNQKHAPQMTEKNAKAVAFSASYLSGTAIPVNGLFKLYHYLGDASSKLTKGSLIGESPADKFQRELELLKKNHADSVTKAEMNTLEDLNTKLSSPKKSVALDKSNSETKD